MLLLTIPVIIAVRIALWLLPSRTMLRLATRFPEPTVPFSAIPISAIVWGVEAVARRVPGATCLTQALSGKLLLSWFGHHSQLCLGIARTVGGSIRAHAWLEQDGRAVLGGAGICSLTRLPELPGSAHLSLN